MKSKAIVFKEPYSVGIEEFELPELEDDTLITETLLSGVSTGTETRVLSGKQEGSKFPLIPGYENLGRIIRVGKNVNLEVGQKVFVGKSDFTGNYCKSWGGHLQYAVCNEDSVIPVPEELDDEKAVYTKIGAISLHGVKRAEVNLNDTVVVVGLGIIGTMAALCSKAFGARVIGIDTDENRLEIINDLIDETINPPKTDLYNFVLEHTNNGADVVIDATGIPQLADNNSRLLKAKDWDDLYHPSGRFVLLGSYTEPVCFNYNESLFMNEINILASRDTVREDLVDMMNLINSGKVDVNRIPQQLFRIQEVKPAYKKLIEEKPFRIAFDWRQM